MLLDSVSMEVDSLLLFMVLALLAEILGTLGGFGSSLFFIPIAGYFLEFHQVLGVTALFHVSSNLAKIALFKQGIEKKIVINLGIPAVVFVIIGAYLTQFLDRVNDLGAHISLAIVKLET